MKKGTILFTFLFAISLSSKAIIYSGTFIFTQQWQVDSFLRPSYFPNCTGILGDVYIFGCSAFGGCPGGIQNLTGLGGILSISGGLVLDGVAPSDNLNGLNSLQSLGSLGIDESSITNLSFLNGLTSLGHCNIGVFGNFMTSLSGLNNITSMTGSISVGFNPSLVNLNILNNVTSIGGDFIITTNPLLSNVSNMNNLTSIGGYFEINSNSSLNNFSGLNNLTFIGHRVRIFNNSALTSLNGLNNLNSTNSFSTNSPIDPSSIQITQCPSLNSLTALNNLVSTSETLNIFNNSSLSQCEATGICSRLGMSITNVNIYGNAMGCNSINQVQTACTNTSTILNLKLFLQGLYTGNSLMSPSLMNQGVTSNTNITDSIEVELHDANSPYTLVRASNTILSTNGSVSCSFSPSITGSYYIVVKHRNGVTTWSATPIAVGTSPTFYDFTTTSSQAYGNNMIQMELGKWAFYSGDLNHDENVDLLDISSLESDINAFQFGYFATDLNGDGNVDLLDSSILEPNVNTFNFSMHP